MSGPLHGLRGIALTHAWAGNYCASLLGLMGADVIQLEVRKRPDNWRGDYNGPIAPALQAVPTAVNPWNNSPLYNSVGLNKRCITLDLQAPEGMAVFLRLLPSADFVVENFSPRVLENLGIGYEQMKALKPDIVLASMSAYGHDGPWAQVPGIGGTIEPTSGNSALLGYVGGPPLNSGTMYPDPVAGVHGMLGLVAALRHRGRTGQGQYIDVSMQEANLSFAGDAALEYQTTGHERPRTGNRHTTYAPHGIYPTAGEERWIAIACEDDAQWRSLAQVLDPALGEDPRFTTEAGRTAHEDELDRELARRTRDLDRDDFVQRLLAAGVIAAPVLDALEVRDSAHLRQRGLLQEVEHPEAGRWWQATLPMQFTSTPAEHVRPAPLQGEHTREVLGDLLGMTTEEVDELVRAGISGSGPPD